MIVDKIDTPVTAHLLEEWEAGTVGVTVQFEHPTEQLDAWRVVAVDALRAIGGHVATEIVEAENAKLDDPADWLTFAEWRAVRDSEVALAALLVAADLAAQAGYVDVARQVRKLHDAHGAQMLTGGAEL